mgnify:CR=1 FL=1
MARKPSERSNSKEVQSELNLAPIMALICILIPALIFAFQFYEITVQSVAAPKLGPKSSAKSDEDKDDKPPLNLTVLISDKGFVLKWNDELSAESGEPPRIPKKVFKDEEGNQVEDYDYPKLYTEVVKKKKDYPEEDSVNIGADFAIPWSTVARTIDCVRVRLAEDAYDELAAYSSAETLKPEVKKGVVDEEGGRQVPLFPKVVFVVAE